MKRIRSACVNGELLLYAVGEDFGVAFRGVQNAVRDDESSSHRSPDGGVVDLKDQIGANHRISRLAECARPS